MSLEDFRGSAFVFKRLMEQAQAEIERGDRKGARVIYPAAKREPQTFWRRWWPVKRGSR